MQPLNYQTRVIVACAIILGALDISVRFATAPKPMSASVVTAQEFRLTDKAGNIRAVMKTDNAGEPGLVMYDRSGTPRLQLDSFQTTPSLILRDQNGEERAYYGMGTADGAGELTFMKPNHEPVAGIAADGGATSFSVSTSDQDATVYHSDCFGGGDGNR